jgi:hypothetical protein
VILPFAILSTPGPAITTAGAQESDRRTFSIVVESSAPAVYSVYGELSGDSPRVAERSPRVAVFRLEATLYLRVTPLAHRDVERGAFAYAFVLSRDAEGEQVVQPTDQQGLKSECCRSRSLGAARAGFRRLPGSRS